MRNHSPHFSNRADRRKEATKKTSTQTNSFLQNVVQLCSKIMTGQSVSGILFFRSVRSSFTSFSLAPIEACDDTNDMTRSIDLENVEPTLVRIQFFDELTELRSFFRRTYKLGDIIEIKGGNWEEIDDKANTVWVKPRLVVNFSSVEEAKLSVTVQKERYWQMPAIQIWQKHFIHKTDQLKENKQKKKTTNEKKNDNDDSHGGGKEKRQQGEIVANFLIYSIMHKLSVEKDDNYWNGEIPKPHEWSQEFNLQKHASLKNNAIDFLNSGSGVVDVAGGSGHVSMALGLAGVKSTIIDARNSVGKLPGRDRKMWNRALKKNRSLATTDDNFCRPIVPFETHRAWFGSMPDGVDASFRHPDEATLAVCDAKCDLIKNASAIVALHPDEATGAVVQIAVENRKPFVIVPCCVFCRLFPNRRKASNNQLVSSYEDLLEYLCEHDSSIQKSKLQFKGKNTVLFRA